MGGILLLCGFLACGLAAADALFRRHSGLIRVWLGLVLGMMLMMWLPVPFAFWMTFNQTAQLCGLGVAALFAGGCAWAARRAPRLAKPFCGEMPAWLPVALVAPLVLLSGYLQYTHVLREVDGALHVGQSTYGDINLHLSIITSLQNASFPPDYAILSGAQLGYPFFADSLSTSMLLFGTGLAQSLAIPGTLMMALVYLGFVIFAWELTRKPAAAVLAYVLMFINGGLGFLYTFDRVFADSSALEAVFTGFYQTPTNMTELNLRWVNVVADMLLPQRTLAAGWMVLLPAMWQLVVAIRENRRRDFVALGIWAGAMPMIHTHSFLALGLLSGGALIYQAIHPGRETRAARLQNFLIYGAIAVAMALPQLVLWTFPQTAEGGARGALSFRFNWVNNQGDGTLIDEYFWFWIKNVGLTYLLIVPAALARRKGGMCRTLALGALLIYVAAELVQFQVNVYDNNKLFYVAYMAVLPAVGLYLVELWQKLRGVRGRALFAACFLFASTVSGALSIGREVVSDYQLYSASDVEAAEFIAENTEQDAVFLTGQQHNNAVACLAGRHILCGASTFLYYHGLDYAEEEAAARLLYEAPAENEALFEAYGIDYVYISSHERGSFAIDTGYFNENAELIFDNFEVQIYRLDVDG